MGKTVMLAGHAKLPQKMAAKTVYESLTLTVEIDRTYGVVLDASCTLATQHAQGFIGRALRGLSLQDGVEPIVKEIEDSYHGKAQHALIAAAREVHQQYLIYSKQTVPRDK